MFQEESGKELLALETVRGEGRYDIPAAAAQVVPIVLACAVEAATAGDGCVAIAATSEVAMTMMPAVEIVDFCTTDVYSHMGLVAVATAAETLQ